MHIEAFRQRCLSYNGVTEETPFDSNTLVFKVMGKMFALTNIELFESINLKCEPEKALALRERYQSVKPGYHMNKKHWNTLEIHGDMPDREIEHWLQHSYELVVKGLPKKTQKLLGEMGEDHSSSS